MIRFKNLGDAGERMAERLLDVASLSSGFTPCVVTSLHPGALLELAARLEETVPTFRRWAPTADLPEKAKTLRAAASAGGSTPRAPSGAAPSARPVIWIEQESRERRFDAAGWASALSSLNLARDSLRSDAPWVWVLAGPPELQELVARQAPDLRSGIVTTLTVTEAPTELHRAVAPLSWLHLSDFHFTADERWERRATLKALLAHVQTLKGEGFTPELVFITGDVAYSGKRGEYEQAELFIRALCEKLGWDGQRSRERLFLVPGNHDVDLAKIQRADAALLKTLDGESAVEDLLRDTEALRLVGRRLEEYYAFHERLVGPVRALSAERPYRSAVVSIHGADVGVLQLNSAWTSHRDARRDLWIGEKQLRDLLDETEGTDVRIALAHHPLSELRDEDEARLGPLLTTGVHFFLRGHLHDDQAVQHAGPDGSFTELAAGASYVTGTHEKTYLAASLDFEKPEAEVRFYRYSPRGSGFWHPNPGAYRAAKDGVWRFALPPALALGGGTDDATGTERQAHPGVESATLVARYRASVAAYHGTVRFIGFTDRRPKANVRVPELYVPLRVRPMMRTPTAVNEEPKELTSADLVRALAPPTSQESSAASPMRRFVILGDPGSGKTTLCRFLAVALAGETDLTGVEVPATCLPLFLPFRDYVRMDRQSGGYSLIDFLVEQAQRELSVRITSEFLVQALERGHAVLILDGFDEVGGSEERERMRDRVAALLAQYPRAPAVVTSRLAGYDQAPLPALDAEGLLQARLAPFTDEDQEAFAEHWYRIQEPTDAVARERGIADLIAALRANAAVRELSRNPMLMTLVALVHRFEAHLPGERAKLYEKCVEMLLEARPAARERTFAPLDAGKERAYLEELALRIQERRIEANASVTIERLDLVALLVSFVLARENLSKPTPEQRHNAKRLVEAWLDYLAEGCGILVEQQPGVYSFFHLSLMEYLAACALIRDPSIPQTIAERFEKSAWRETCLLAIGHKEQVTNRGFLTELLRALERRAHVVYPDPRWDFLLAALGEEADFNDQERTEIVRGALQNNVHRTLGRGRATVEVCSTLLRFSRRHSAWLAAFLESELREAEGDGLLGLAALGVAGSLRARTQDASPLLSEKEVMAALDARSDRPVVAATLLELWPIADLGKWAVTYLALPQTARCAEYAAYDLTVLRALAVLWQDGCQRPEGVVAALGAISRSGWLASAAARAHVELAERDLPGGKGLPSALPVSLGTHPSWIRFQVLHPTISRRGVSSGTNPRFTYPFARELAGGVAKFFATDFVSSFDVALGRKIVIEFVASFDIDVAGEVVPDFARDFAPYYFARDNAPYLASELARDFAVERNTALLTPFPQAPNASLDSAELREFDLLQSRGGNREDSVVLTLLLHLRQRGEAYVAALTAIGLPTPESRLLFLASRLQHRALLPFWLALDSRLNVQDPIHLATYLCLGWTQACTTWTWPGTPRWIELLGGAPPSHWWPRAQFHLAWLVHEPDSAVHQAALGAALEEGRLDPELPGVADALDRLLG